MDWLREYHKLHKLSGSRSVFSKRHMQERHFSRRLLLSSIELGQGLLSLSHLLPSSLSFYRLLSAFDLVLQVRNALLLGCLRFGWFDLTEVHVSIYKIP